jgi:hypothetical protein
MGVGRAMEEASRRGKMPHSTPNAEVTETPRRLGGHTVKTLYDRSELIERLIQQTSLVLKRHQASSNIKTIKSSA